MIDETIALVLIEDLIIFVTVHDADISSAMRGLMGLITYIVRLIFIYLLIELIY